MCAFFDDMSDFTSFVYTPECVIRIAVSCFFALGVNISNYLVLGMTSPLTYQVPISLRFCYAYLHFVWFALVWVVRWLHLFLLFIAGQNKTSGVVLQLFTLRLSIQVLGHLKTVLILVLGFVVFHVRISCAIDVFPFEFRSIFNFFWTHLSTYYFCRNRWTCATWRGSP